MVLDFLTVDNFDFTRKIVKKKFWRKTRENLEFLTVDNFDFTRKIVKKFWVKNSWKYWGFAGIVKIAFFEQKFDF